jgi:hypothetical protein
MWPGRPLPVGCTTIIVIIAIIITTIATIERVYPR